MDGLRFNFDYKLSPTIEVKTMAEDGYTQFETAYEIVTCADDEDARLQKVVKCNLYTLNRITKLTPDEFEKSELKLTLNKEFKMPIGFGCA
jgi:hypothetical protein